MSVNIKIGNNITNNVDTIRVKSSDGSTYYNFTYGVTNDCLNFAFGDTAPNDTSKIWFKCDQPTAIEVKRDWNAAINNRTDVSTIYTFPVNVIHDTNYYAFNEAYSSVNANEVILRYGSWGSDTKCYLYRANLLDGTMSCCGSIRNNSDSYYYARQIYCDGQFVIIYSRQDRTGYWTGTQTSYTTYYCGGAFIGTLTGDASEVIISDYSSNYSFPGLNGGRSFSPINYFSTLYRHGNILYSFGGQAPNEYNAGIWEIDLINKTTTYHLITSGSPTMNEVSPYTALGIYDNKLYFKSSAGNMLCRLDLSTYVWDQPFYPTDLSTSTGVIVGSNLIYYSSSSNKMYKVNLAATSWNVENFSSTPNDFISLNKVFDATKILGYKSTSTGASIKYYDLNVEVPNEKLIIMSTNTGEECSILNEDILTVGLPITAAMIGDANSSGNRVEVYKYKNNTWTKIA